jgi:hypothetical protein
MSDQAPAAIVSAVRLLPIWLRARPDLVAYAPLVVGVALLFAVGVAHDPASGVTGSKSPFTDEGYNVYNARNLVLLGRWSVDSWNLHLVNLPFSLVMVGVFATTGVGIVQARLATIVATALTVGVLGVGLGRAFGRWVGFLAAVALATSTLVLFYGRLVYLEDLVALGLVVGAMTLLVVDRRPLGAALVAGAALAIAIGTKPNAAFPVAGMWLAVGIGNARRDAAIRRWLGASAAVIACAAVLWLLVIWLPNRAAVSADLMIWPRIEWPGSVSEAIKRIANYVGGRADDHAISASLPLLVLAAAGVVGLVAGRSSLGTPQRRLVAAAIGWFVLGMAVNLLSSYRPNRYVVPLLPAAAILGAAGLPTWGRLITANLGRRALAPAALAVLVSTSAPGLLAYAGWIASTGSTLPAFQDGARRTLPAGSAAAGGDAPTLLLTAPVRAIPYWPGLPGNEGDLYTTAGARWFLALRDGTTPMRFPDGVWERRTLASCLSWYGQDVCLFHVP